MRGWESSAKSLEGEERFWNVQRHRGVNGNEIELEECGAGSVWGQVTGETEW